MTEMRFSSEEEGKAEAELKDKISKLFEREIELSTLRANLKCFAAEFLSQVGVKIVQLDEYRAKEQVVFSEKEPGDQKRKQEMETAFDKYQMSLWSFGETEEVAKIPDSFLISEDLKTLFLDVLWKVHPDLDPDEGEKLLQKKLIRDACDALERMDPDRLHSIILEWDESPDSTKPPQNLPYFIRFIRKRAQVDERGHHVKTEIREIRGSDLYKLRSKVEGAQKNNQILLDEMAQKLDDEIRLLEEANPNVSEQTIPVQEKTLPDPSSEAVELESFFTRISTLAGRGLELADDRLSLFIKRELENVTSSDLSKEERWDTYIRAGQRFFEQRNFPEAEKLFSSAVQEAESFDNTDSRLVDSLGYLSRVYRSQSKYEEMKPLYQRILDIQKNNFGPDHPETAKTMSNLAGLYRAIGRVDDAEDLYLRALVLQEKVHGPDHLEVAQNLSQLASIYSSQGRNQEAESILSRLIFSKERMFGPDHKELATDLNNLAMFYHTQGRYDEAEHLYFRAIRIEEKTVGTESAEVAMSLNNLAALYRAYGKYAHAEPHARRSVAINEKYLPPDHPNLAISLKTLASLRRAYGNYGEAEKYYRRALEIEEINLDPFHPDLAGSLNNLAVLYDTQGRLEEAEPLYLRALNIREKIFGPDHIDVALSLNNLAVLYLDLGRCKEAEPLFNRSLKIRKEKLGSDHLDVAASLEGYAALMRKTDRNPEAEELESKAKAIRVKTMKTK